MRPNEKSIVLSTGENLKYDKLILATGSSPREIDAKGKGDTENVFILRTPEDANAIAKAAKGKDAVVVGTSFIGMEVASYLATEGKAGSVTVVGSSGVPFAHTLGEEIGKLLQKMHEEKGVKFVLNSGVEEYVSGENKAVKELVLKGGQERIKADLIVLGVGVTPNTGFLKDSGIDMTSKGYVKVNDRLETNVPGVFAAGDIANFPLASAGNQVVNIGHWQLSMAHGRCAARNAAGQETSLRSVPFFWTQQYGKSIRYAGYGAGYDELVVDGNVADGAFVTYFCKKGVVMAVATLGKDPVAAQFANLLAEGKTIAKDDALNNWQKNF